MADGSRSINSQPPQAFCRFHGENLVNYMLLNPCDVHAKGLLPKFIRIVARTLCGSLQMQIFRFKVRYSLRLKLWVIWCWITHNGSGVSRLQNMARADQAARTISRIARDQMQPRQQTLKSGRFKSISNLCDMLPTGPRTDKLLLRKCPTIFKQRCKNSELVLQKFELVKRVEEHYSLLPGTLFRRFVVSSFPIYGSLIMSRARQAIRLQAEVIDGSGGHHRYKNARSRNQGRTERYADRPRCPVNFARLAQRPAANERPLPSVHALPPLSQEAILP